VPRIGRLDHEGSNGHRVALGVLVGPANFLRLGKMLCSQAGQNLWHAQNLGEPHSPKYKALPPTAIRVLLAVNTDDNLVGKNTAVPSLVRDGALDHVIETLS